MKFITILALTGLSIAYPGSKGVKKDHSGIFKALIERAGERLLEERQGGPPTEPITKIGNLQDAGTGGSSTNDRIMNCFNSANGASCLTTELYVPPLKDTTACAADTCCIWAYIRDELLPIFRESDGTCNDIARNTVRFGFHDAGAWDKSQTHGGADGSLLLSSTETARLENSGLDKAKTALLPFYLKYKPYGISAADFVQFAHNVAVVACPLGPRSLTFVGRPEWQPTDEENPIGLLPDARSSADVNLDLFADKTIGTIDLVALIGAHTTAKQFFFDTDKAGMPLDSTPGVWDVAFYSEVLAGAPKCGVFRLPSDDFLGNSSATTRGFTALAADFPNDVGSGQELWNGLYARAYLRLSLLGVADVQGLTDCSKVLPLGTPIFPKPPSAIVTCPASSSIISSTSSVDAVSSSAVSGGSSAVPYESYGSSGVPPVYEGLSTGKAAPGTTMTWPSKWSNSSSTCTKSKKTASHSTVHPSSEYPSHYQSGVPSMTGSVTTVTKTHTTTDSVGATKTSCETFVLTTTKPTELAFSYKTATLTHVSTFAVMSGKTTTSTWEVPVTSVYWDDRSPALSTRVFAAPSPSTCQGYTVTVKEIATVYVTEPALSTNVFATTSPSTCKGYTVTVKEITTAYVIAA